MGAVSTYRCHHTGICISIIKIRRSRPPCFFILEILIPGKTAFILGRDDVSLSKTISVIHLYSPVSHLSTQSYYKPGRSSDRLNCAMWIPTTVRRDEIGPEPNRTHIIVNLQHCGIVWCHMKPETILFRHIPANIIHKQKKMAHQSDIELKKQP